MRILSCAVLVGLCGVVGCVELPLLRDYGAPVAKPAREQPVTAAEVTTDNASQIAIELREELDKDQATVTRDAPLSDKDSK